MGKIEFNRKQIIAEGQGKHSVNQGTVKRIMEGRKRLGNRTFDNVLRLEPRNQ